MKYKSTEDYWKRFDKIVDTKRGKQMVNYKIMQHYIKMFCNFPKPPLEV